jgi:hypothetical protein
MVGARPAQSLTEPNAQNLRLVRERSSWPDFGGPQMSNDGDHVERVVVETPTTVRREEVRVVRESSNAGWWIAALVAIVAIVGVIFLMNNSTSQDDLQNARTEGAAQQALATAASDAQMAASQASQAAQTATQGAAQATENAAQAAAERTAQAADAAAAATQGAADTETPPPN